MSEMATEKGRSSKTSVIDGTFLAIERAQTTLFVSTCGKQPFDGTFLASRCRPELLSWLAYHNVDNFLQNQVLYRYYLLFLL